MSDYLRSSFTHEHIPPNLEGTTVAPSLVLRILQVIQVLDLRTYDESGDELSSQSGPATVVFVQLPSRAYALGFQFDNSPELFQLGVLLGATHVDASQIDLILAWCMAGKRFCLTTYNDKDFWAILACFGSIAGTRPVDVSDSLRGSESAVILPGYPVTTTNLYQMKAGIRFTLGLLLLGVLISVYVRVGMVFL
ncbi:hypothetical protein EVJ58_g7305 [Rhodofomes roseus]|uniref:Uncharacterized protein n=1 Tax=Rhodofomes roseus TaxID=34475 RepID=A0A4Y9Y826_9APHY|nr:hypothetical protein EVJ58_g7305 [Rhodofomes roseus]